MDHYSLTYKAEKLRKHIISGEASILPEVWDVASARVLTDSGFHIIGTSATAISWAQGYKPHERMKLEELLIAAARVTRGAIGPINADLEGSLGGSIEEVKRGIQAAIAIGCAGVTMGDGSRNGVQGVIYIEEMVARLKAARSVAHAMDIPLVLTARTEAFLLGPMGKSPFDTTVERAQAYFAAGADCVLISGVQNLQILERLRRYIEGPIAISITLASTPDLEAYGDIGISCITLGSSLMRSLLGNLRSKAEELLAFGHFSHLDRAIPRSELEELLR